MDRGNVKMLNFDLIAFLIILLLIYSYFFIGENPHTPKEKQ